MDNSIKLDIGCGKNKKPGFWGVDIDKKSDADIFVSALELPFGNESVTEIYSAHLVEHFNPEDAQKFFNEIHRVLKKGGIAGLKIDRDWTKIRLLKKDSTHKYRYNEKEILDMVKNLNFNKFKVKKKIYLLNIFTLQNKIFVRLKK